jgi:hypothetical protein
MLSAPFDAVLSTLVLEHFPLNTFFGIQSHFLRPNGVLLLTNMHPEMGAKSQAGFVRVDESGNRVKVRGSSWVHSVDETVDSARIWGFEAVGEVRERAVEKDMVEALGQRAAKWIGISVWYGMALGKSAQ